MELNHDTAKREALRIQDEYPKLIQPNKTTVNLALCYLDLLSKMGNSDTLKPELEEDDEGGNCQHCGLPCFGSRCLICVEKMKIKYGLDPRGWPDNGPC
jgi:hypothetical protein